MSDSKERDDMGCGDDNDDPDECEDREITLVEAVTASYGQVGVTVAHR